MNQEQIFFDFKLNFNLSNSDTKKATTIYTAVYYKRKKYRINTGVEVYSSQWNKKRQCTNYHSNALLLPQWIKTVPDISSIVVISTYSNGFWMMKRFLIFGSITYEKLDKYKEYLISKGILIPTTSILVALLLPLSVFGHSRQIR